MQVTAPNPCPQPVPEASSETSAPLSILRVPRSPPRTKQETSLQDPAPSPAPLLPLGEVAGAEGIVWVHVPFSLTDLSQIEKHLDSFSSDPNNYLKEFKYLIQSYNLAWHDIYIIHSSIFSQKRRNEDGKPLKRTLMRYTGQITLSPWSCPCRRCPWR